ncbi:uncharacterized protein LOC105686198 [Athalia rosae]|uniref:uncharacterized protein LOC105686198 n=1 Tax=Athalia rosae TaxID=37344 RepID=UPI0020336D2B|nr:uncharacterized protein LOC105686198 [Athalia rosae]
MEIEGELSGDVLRVDQLKKTRRKRMRVQDNRKCLEDTAYLSACPVPRSAGITRLPVEVLIEICTYLNSRDLFNLREVCEFFKIVVSSPVVWRTYEVTGNEVNTYEVIDELRRMPFLRKFILAARTDCDEIIRQLSVTNKSLEELHILNCTGSAAKLYLKPNYLIRILDRCSRLHTINILGCRFRGVKFYRRLADMGLRLRAANTPATYLQFKTFADNALHIPEAGRKVIIDMCFGVRQWSPLHYYVIDQRGSAPTVLISYLNRDFISVLVLDEV